MINIRDQWCIQFDVTNNCMHKCSNCTRHCGNIEEPFYMSPDYFRASMLKVLPFLDQEPDVNGRERVLGIIGGEPTLSPWFDDYVNIIEALVPKRSQRGLWTCRKLSPRCRDVFGYVNLNDHKGTVKHQPVLVASKDVVTDTEARYKLQDNCWVQREWASSITPRGLFFCEVAASFDMLCNGPGGRDPQDWIMNVEGFNSQFEWCERCGCCLPLPPRDDSEETDDVSESNIPSLLENRKYAVSDGELISGEWKPQEYKR